MAKNHVFLKQSRKKQPGGLPGIYFVCLFMHLYLHIHIFPIDSPNAGKLPVWKIDSRRKQTKDSGGMTPV